MDTVAGSGSALGYLDMLSGGAFASATLFAMSITRTSMHPLLCSC